MYSRVNSGYFTAITHNVPCFIKEYSLDTLLILFTFQLLLSQTTDISK